MNSENRIQMSTFFIEIQISFKSEDKKSMKSISRSWSKSFGRKLQYPFLFLKNLEIKSKCQSSADLKFGYHSKTSKRVAAKGKKLKILKKV